MGCEGLTALFLRVYDFFCAYEMFSSFPFSMVRCEAISFVVVVLA